MSNCFPFRVDYRELCFYGRSWAGRHYPLFDLHSMAIGDWEKSISVSLFTQLLWKCCIVLGGVGGVGGGSTPLVCESFGGFMAGRVAVGKFFGSGKITLVLSG